MTTRPRDIGTLAETAVVRAIHPWFPHAERRALRGTLDAGDITGTPGVAWEVKGGDAAAYASDAQIVTWLLDTEKERVNAGADVGVLVLKRKGVGPKHAQRWWAVVRVGALVSLCTRTEWGVRGGLGENPVRIRLDHLCQMLARAGYGVERAA